MIKAEPDLIRHLLDRLRQVRRSIGAELAAEETADASLADDLDSMAMVEFLTLVAADLGTTPGVVEEAVGREFGSVAELADSLQAAGLRLYSFAAETPSPKPATRQPIVESWLSATAVHLPACYQRADMINRMLERPADWLERHAGIQGRHIWGDEDPLGATVHIARGCLAEAETSPEEVGALLVTSEAPPLLVGLAAALHGRLGMRTDALAVEVGAACTGYLAALRLGQSLLAEAGVVLIVAVEAPSRYLELQPGSAGETAALFGDAAAASVLCQRPLGGAALPIREVLLGVDGNAG